jgi:tRNA G18 (ribose-2'-O)-methylase SpoU
MPVLRLDTRDHPLLAPYRNLKASNETRWAGQFVVEGRLLVERLIASDFEILSLLVSERYLREVDEGLRERCQVLVVPNDWVEEIVGFNFHRGMLACSRRKPITDLEALCAAQGKRLTLVVCPDVQNPENLGSILRIASAFGVAAVALGPECADPLSRRVLRVSMGAALSVPIAVIDDLAATLEQLRRLSGCELWATVTDRSAAAFDELARPDRLAVLFGSEGHGLTAPILELCDRLITVPMRPGVDSLNVAVAAGIVLHHLTRL